MTNEMNASVVADVELILGLVFHYTDEQIAEVWDKQLIPNRIEDGQRIADLGSAVVYLEGVLAK
jgi:hypothetical protein